jgi:hypothetical protein
MIIKTWPYFDIPHETLSDARPRSCRGFRGTWDSSGAYSLYLIHVPMKNNDILCRGKKIIGEIMPSQSGHRVYKKILFAA